MDQLTAMRSFVKVVDTGGFSEAARQLDLAVSSVTRQVNALESRLHTQLLNRSTRSVTLTPQGHKYYDRVVKILQDIEEADGCVMEREDVPHGVLRISVPVAFGQLHIAPLLGDFLAQCPEIRLEVQLSDGLANLVEEDLDLVVRVGNLERSNDSLILHKLAPYTRLLCGSPAYFEQYGIPTHPDRLTQHNCLLFAYGTNHDVWQFQRGAEMYEVCVQGSVVANNSELLRQVCVDGGGLILMPTWLTSRDIQTGQLQPVLTDFIVQRQAEGERGIYALHLPNRRHSLRVKAFIKFLAHRLDSRLCARDEQG